MPKSILTLRDPNNPALPGEVKELQYVGMIQGGGANSLLTFFNEDVAVETEQGIYGGPKPYFAIAIDRVYSLETPEFDREPVKAEAPPALVLPSHMSRGRH